MKFLCPSCKAKYQIADEKVAGKSVRMKCRKCGYLIQVTSTLAEAPSIPPPAPSPSPAPAPVATAHRPLPVATAAAPRGAPPPRRAPPPRKPAPAAAPPPRAASPLAAPPARAPVAGRGAAGASAASAAYALNDDESTQIAGPGALAGAFAAAVEAAPASTALLEDLASAANDWYVGINGVPVGPIKLSELRSKAASHAVTIDSLVWRDGFDNWLPLGTFPELVAIVEEGMSSARASIGPLTPPTTAGGASAVGALADPFKIAGAPVTGPAVVTERVGDLDVDALVPPRRAGSPAAWIAVVVALLFGLTIGFVAFNKDKQVEQVVKYVQVPASGAAAQPAPGDTSQQTAGNDENKGENNGKGGHVALKGGTVPKGADSAGKPTGLTGLQGLSGLGGATGPKAPNIDGPTAGNSGEPLDGAKVQSTVARYTSSVRRQCWQPALDARDKDAPTSARVSVAITVSPSGSVQSASTSGDPKGYRGLASCIGSKVRGWQFPASSGTTTVNVPFVFAAQ